MGNMTESDKLARLVANSQYFFIGVFGKVWLALAEHLQLPLYTTDEWEGGEEGF